MIKYKFDADALNKKLKSIDSDKIQEEVLQQLGLIVKTNARRYVPVDTGALRASIDLEVNGDEAIVGTPLDYAPYIEYGTVNQPPQPYLIPALEDANNVAQDVVNGVIRKYVQ